MPIFILLSPFILASIINNYFQRKHFLKKYIEFLNENNGMNFFCYNNRKKSKNYIEESIIPNLTDKIEVVYLNGRKVESENNTEFVSEALYRLKNYNRFPHLIKIRDGQLLDKSINNSFYNILNQNKSKTDFIHQINKFFDINP